MNIESLKKNGFWMGVGLILASLLGVGGWEIWSTLSAASDQVGRFTKSNEKLKGRTQREIPSDKEIDYWRNLYKQFEASFNAHREKIVREEEFEDVYFRSGLEPAFWQKDWKPLPDLGDVDAAKSSQHWVLPDTQKQIPPGAFDLPGFAASYDTNRKKLAEKLKDEVAFTPSLLKMPEVDKNDPASAVECQEVFWSFRMLGERMAAFKRKHPSADLEVAAVEYFPKESVGIKGSKGVGSVGKTPLDGARETKFYRAIPINVSLSVDVTAFPDLLTALLAPEAGKSMSPFRFRDCVEIDYLGADRAEGTLHGKTAAILKKGGNTRVGLTIQIEWWNWEIRALSDYNKG